MADWPVHRDRADHNQGLHTYLSSERPNGYPDWQVIALFYAAVHLVDAFLDYKHGEHPESHSYDSQRKSPGRTDLVWSHLKPIHSPYRYLLDVSIWARYDPDVPIDEAKVLDAMGSFAKVKAHVIAELPPPAVPPAAGTASDL